MVHTMDDTTSIRRIFQEQHPLQSAHKRFDHVTGDWEAIGIGGEPLGYFATPQDADCAIDAYGSKMTRLTGKAA